MSWLDLLSRKKKLPPSLRLDPERAARRQEAFDKTHHVPLLLDNRPTSPPQTPRTPSSLHQHQPNDPPDRKNSQDSGKSLEFAVSDASSIFTVAGRPWRLTQRREFRDHSGLPLFELSCRWYDPETLSVQLPGGGWGEEALLTAKILSSRAHRTPKVCAHLQNAAQRPSTLPVYSAGDVERGAVSEDAEDVVLYVYGDPHFHYSNTVEWEGRVVATRRRAMFKEQPHGSRPNWEMKTAKGADLSLMAIVAIVLAQKANGDPYGQGTTRIMEVI
ncbi:hypothetical protein BDW62DRAFT_199158 [Aspergillus aurantiobrunneus]